MGLSRFFVTDKSDAQPMPTAAPIVVIGRTVMPDRGAASRWIDGTTREGMYPSFLGWDNNHQIQLGNGVSKLALRKDQYPLGPLGPRIPQTPTITNPNNPQPHQTWNTTGNAPKSMGLTQITQAVSSSGNTSGSGPGSVIFTGPSEGIM